MSTVATALQNNGTPESAIKVRRMNFDFDVQAIDTFWCDGNPFLTCMLSALSVGFPAGERFFIDSVRHYQGQVKDPQLLADIRGFIGQEANHTKEHLALNHFMDEKGFPIKAMEAYVAKRIKQLQEMSSPEMNLARTAALEHFTAIIAGAFLENPEVIEAMHPQMAKIWAWHAVEEVEHRAVAFDVFKTAVNDERLRRRAMIITTVMFILIVSARTLSLLKTSGHLFDVGSWRKGLGVLWGRRGIFWPLIPQYLAYYSKRFHPSQHNNEAEVEAARTAYLAS